MDFLTLGKLDVTFSSTVRTIFFVLIFYGGFLVNKKRLIESDFELRLSEINLTNCFYVL